MKGGADARCAHVNRNGGRFIRTIKGWMQHTGRALLARIHRDRGNRFSIRSKDHQLRAIFGADYNAAQPSTLRHGNAGHSLYHASR